MILEIPLCLLALSISAVVLCCKALARGNVLASLVEASVLLVPRPGGRNGHQCFDGLTSGHELALVSPVTC